VESNIKELHVAMDHKQIDIHRVCDSARVHVTVEEQERFEQRIRMAELRAENDKRAENDNFIDKKVGKDEGLEI
jgi:hypothetical protein